jgi:hypothetical protein
MAKASAQGSQYSVEQVAAIKASVISAIEKGVPISHATEAAAKNEGVPLVHSTTILNWRKKDREFDAAMRDAHTTGTHRLLDIGRQAAIQQIIGSPNAVSAALWIFCMVNLADQARSGNPYDWHSINHPKAGEMTADVNGPPVHVTFEVKNGKGKPGGKTDS